MSLKIIESFTSAGVKAADEEIIEQSSDFMLDLFPRGIPMVRLMSSFSPWPIGSSRRALGLFWGADIGLHCAKPQQSHEVKSSV